MVSDSEIINRLKDYKPKFIDSNGNEIHRSILSSGNGKLLNVDDKFDESTLKLDTSVNIKRHALNFIEYSGLNPEDQTYQIVEPVALLTAQEGKSKLIKPVWSDDESFIGQNVQIEEDNAPLTFQKFYPTDYGELADGLGHDIPQRQIMNSKDSIILGTKEDTTTTKKSFIIGSSQTSITGRKCAIYLNEIINNYVIIPGATYHGECEFFDYKFIPPDTVSINDVCSGKFIVKQQQNLLVLESEEDDYGRYIMLFRNGQYGWRMNIKDTNPLGFADISLDFESTIDFKIISDYNGQLPLPVQLVNISSQQGVLPESVNVILKRYENDIIKWTTNYNPPIAKNPLSIVLPLKMDSNPEFSTNITLQNWNIDYNDNENSLEINFEHQMIDDNENNLPLDNNYYFEEILFKYPQSKEKEEEHIPINKSYIDRDPFSIKLKFNNVFYKSIEEGEESSNV